MKKKYENNIVCNGCGKKFPETKIVRKILSGAAFCIECVENGKIML